jgi:pyruvate formate lyase activating enzyme
MKEAGYYEVRDGIVHCLLCPQNCHLRDGETGRCGVRRADGSRLVSLNYEMVSSIALDPIEKKPLYHFYPGSYILSIGTVGCNLSCGFCQNYELSTGRAATRRMSSDHIVELAKRKLYGETSIGIAYTYSEPMVWFEYVMETAQRARDAGLKNVLVTNGEVLQDPLEELLEVVDAMNIDVKAFSRRFYSKACSGPFKPVLETVERAAGRCHVEVTNLLIPTLNDSDEEFGSLVSWLANLDDSIPLHISRYFPHHRMNLPPTPVAAMLRAYEIARQSLKYVYLGNVGDEEHSTTFCHECGAAVVVRSPFRMGVEVFLDGRKCKKCGAEQRIVL